MNEPADNAAVTIARLERRAARDRAARIEAEGIAEAQLRRSYQRSREVELLAAIAVIVNDSDDVTSALSAAARAVRRHCGFAVSHVLVPDDDGAFVTSDIWDADPERLDFLEVVLAATADERFVPPRGLPGEVAASHLAIWLPDIANAPNFPRVDTTLSGAAWAFPVVTGVEVAAVIEFLDPAPRLADERLLDLAASLGSQLGRAVDWDRSRRREGEDRRRLEVLVAEQSEALQAAQREGQSADHARNAFVAHLAHDAGAGVGRLREAMDGTGDEESVRDLMVELEASVQRLLSVVEGTEQRVAGKREPVVPGELVEAVVARTEGGAGISVTVDDAARGPVELAVPLVERVLSEMLDNAVRHGRGARVTVSVSLSADTLEVVVRDTGPGFTWDQNGIRPRGRSGLAQGARIAAALGGRLTVTALPEGGTEAVLRVAARPSATPVDLGQSSRVLVVDDNEINRRLAAAMLGRVGLPADVVDSAETALVALRTTAYGLVLMDIQMPGMDGRQATRAWRESTGGATPAEVPIVALTAHVGQEERDACSEAGMSDYLSKPFGIDGLDTMCRRWLTAGAQAGSGASR